MRSLLATCTAVLLGCAPKVQPLSWQQEGWLVHEEAGVAVAMPVNWHATRATTGVVAGGDEGSPDYYTTLAIQAVRPSATARISDILRTAYEHPSIGDSLLPVTPRLARPTTEGAGQGRGAGVGETPNELVPCVAGDTLGVCYAVSFTVFAEPRRRLGVLLDLAPYVVDVSFTAPSASFPDHVDVFERALATLYVEPAS